jgi:hypothetical protein
VSQTKNAFTPSRVFHVFYRKNSGRRFGGGYTREVLTTPESTGTVFVNQQGEVLIR